MRPRLQASLDTWRSVLREPNLRRVQLAFLGFNVAEYATWVAVMVYAYRAGGVVAAGLVGAGQLVPAALVAPLASVLGDRYRRDFMLTLGYVAQAVTMLLTGLAMVVNAPLLLVYPLATLAACSITLTRPVQGALLPALARTVDELTAANVVSGWMEGVGIFIGPLVSGALLVTGNPGLVFLGMGAVLVGAVALTAGLHVVGAASRTSSSPPIGEDVLAGIRHVLGVPTSRTVVTLLSSNFFLVGSADVLFVILSFRLLGLGGSGVGFMNAAFGLGVICAAAAMAGAITERRVSPAIRLGAVSWAIGLCCTALVHDPASAVLCVVLAGAGRPLVDVAGRTLLQRTVDAHLLTRVLGVVEGLSMAAMAAGSLLVPFIALSVGDRLTFVALAGVLPALLLVTWRPLRRADSATPVPARTIDLLRRIPFFAPLPGLTLERLGMDLVELEVSAGTEVVRQGDPGDRFYIIDSGTAAVSRSGRHLQDLAPGDYFGEIALLREVTRTATVSASSNLHVQALDRDLFLEALTLHPQSREAAENVVETHLESDTRAPVSG